MGINWEGLWQQAFGIGEWGGLDMGFWVSMTVVALLVVVQNVVFWCCFKKGNKYAPKDAAARGAEALSK